jgi:hypothetical protein
MHLPRLTFTAPIAGALVVVLIAFVLIGGEAPGGDRSCGSIPDAGLAPAGEGAAAFTMGLRVNQPADVAAIESELGSRVLTRDVFVVNTEFPGSNADAWSGVVAEVRKRFPCNRIATLNGLGTRPDRPGYMHALAGQQDVDAILLDWEPDTWADTGRGAWTPELEANLGRIAGRMNELSEDLKGTATRMGLVPDYVPPWDYGRTGRVIAELNRELDSEHRGYQVVQTQPNCGSPAAPGPLIGPLAAQLRRQYRPIAELVSTEHLGFEIAFDSSPDPHASEAVERIGPAQAASCSTQILGAGGAAILYWASPAALRAMLDTSAGGVLRPSSG